MGGLPVFRRFLAEDYSSQSSWIGPLLYGLNLILNTLYSNLNNGLTIQQNMLAQTKTLPIKGDSPKTTIPWPFNSSPIGVTLVQTLQTDTPNISTPTVTASGTTSLDNKSTYNQTFTGSATQTINLPPANTLATNSQFQITNRSTAFLTLNDGSGVLIQLIAPGCQSIVTVTNIGSIAGTWVNCTSGIIPNAPTCDWSYSAGVVSINNVTGLNAAHVYNCTFVVWGG